MIGVFTLTGCTVVEMDKEKVQDINYYIVQEEFQPSEIQYLIEENKENQMKMSYIDQGKEYLIIGYGAQETSGYSVQVVALYETENTVYVKTNLLGASGNEEVEAVITYPYIVICIEENEKIVVFD